MERNSTMALGCAVIVNSEMNPQVWPTCPIFQTLGLGTLPLGWAWGWAGFRNFLERCRKDSKPYDLGLGRFGTLLYFPPIFQICAFSALREGCPTCPTLLPRRMHRGRQMIAGFLPRKAFPVFVEAAVLNVSAAPIRYRKSGRCRRHGDARLPLKNRHGDHRDRRN